MDEFLSLSVEGMLGSSCENIVKKMLISLNGVKNVRVDLNHKKVFVEYDSEKVSVQTIRDTIEDQGYEVK